MTYDPRKRRRRGKDWAAPDGSDIKQLQYHRQTLATNFITSQSEGEEVVNFKEGPRFFAVPRHLQECCKALPNVRSLPGPKYIYNKYINRGMVYEK